MAPYHVEADSGSTVRAAGLPPLSQSTCNPATTSPLWPLSVSYLSTKKAVAAAWQRQTRASLRVHRHSDDWTKCMNARLHHSRPPCLASSSSTAAWCTQGRILRSCPPSLPSSAHSSPNGAMCSTSNRPTPAMTPGRQRLSHQQLPSVSTSPLHLTRLLCPPLSQLQPHLFHPVTAPVLHPLCHPQPPPFLFLPARS